MGACQAQLVHQYVGCVHQHLSVCGSQGQRAGCSCGEYLDIGGNTSQISVIDRRHHETGLWCFECEDVFWAPTGADAKAVRSLHHNHCIVQNNTDFIGLDDVGLRGGCVCSHTAHQVGGN